MRHISALTHRQSSTASDEKRRDGWRPSGVYPRLITRSESGWHHTEIARRKRLRADHQAEAKIVSGGSSSTAAVHRQSGAVTSYELGINHAAMLEVYSVCVLCLRSIISTSFILCSLSALDGWLIATACSAKLAISTGWPKKVSHYQIIKISY